MWSVRAAGLSEPGSRWSECWCDEWGFFVHLSLSLSLRCLITMLWRWWSGGSRTLWGCLTPQVKINVLMESVVNHALRVRGCVDRVSSCRSGGLRPPATPQLPSDRRLPRLLLCGFTLLLWERPREGLTEAHCVYMLQISLRYWLVIDNDSVIGGRQTCLQSPWQHN